MIVLIHVADNIQQCLLLTQRRHGPLAARVVDQ
jgi:hypothetical protein